MSDFNLIPEEYRQRVVFLRDLKWFAVVAASLLLLIVCGYLILHQDNNRYQKQLSSLKKEQQSINDYRKQIDELNQLQSEIEKRYQTLLGFKGKYNIRQSMMALDGTLNEDIRFTSLEFKRGDALGLLNAAGSRDDTQQERAQVYRSIVAVKGVAKTHASMADFMRELNQRQEVEWVELLNSQAQGLESGQGLEFQLRLVLREKVTQG